MLVVCDDLYGLYIRLIGRGGGSPVHTPSRGLGLVECVYGLYIRLIGRGGSPVHTPSRGLGLVECVGDGWD